MSCGTTSASHGALMGSRLQRKRRFVHKVEETMESPSIFCKVKEMMKLRSMSTTNRDGCHRRRLQICNKIMLGVSGEGDKSTMRERKREKEKEEEEDDDELSVRDVVATYEAQLVLIVEREDKRDRG